MPDAVQPLIEMTRRGTVTPEHVLHNKPFPAHVNGADLATGMRAFADECKETNYAKKKSFFDKLFKK